MIFNNLEIYKLIKWYFKFFIDVENEFIIILVLGFMINVCLWVVSDEMGQRGCDY